MGPSAGPNGVSGTIKTHRRRQDGREEDFLGTLIDFPMILQMGLIFAELQAGENPQRIRPGHRIRRGIFRGVKN